MAIRTVTGQLGRVEETIERAGYVRIGPEMGEKYGLRDHKSIGSTPKRTPEERAMNLWWDPGASRRREPALRAGLSVRRRGGTQRDHLRQGRRIRRPSDGRRRRDRRHPV